MEVLETQLTDFKNTLAFVGASLRPWGRGAWCGTPGKRCASVCACAEAYTLIGRRRSVDVFTLCSHPARPGRPGAGGRDVAGAKQRVSSPAAGAAGASGPQVARPASANASWRRLAAVRCAGIASGSLCDSGLRVALLSSALQPLGDRRAVAAIAARICRTGVRVVAVLEGAAVRQLARAVLRTTAAALRATVSRQLRTLRAVPTRMRAHQQFHRTAAQQQKARQLSTSC